LHVNFIIIHRSGFIHGLKTHENLKTSEKRPKSKNQVRFRYHSAKNSL